MCFAEIPSVYIYMGRGLCGHMCVYICRQGRRFQPCAPSQILFSFHLSCLPRIFPSQLFLCSLDADIRKEGRTLSFLFWFSFSSCKATTLNFFPPTVLKILFFPFYDNSLLGWTPIVWQQGSSTATYLLFYRRTAQGILHLKKQP